MACTIYLAMTAAEFAAAAPLPPKVGWMACHFSPYGTGLCNLPGTLPADSLLILNDRIPLRGHDPERVAGQLTDTAQALGCSAVLLDFQGPRTAELHQVSQAILRALPCPVALSAEYAEDLNTPVFLPPCPHHTPLREHIAPWQGRELWLDLAADAQTITLTERGAEILPLSLGELPAGGHREDRLHCHYSAQTGDDFARFTLWRTRKDLEEMAQEAEKLGIRTLVGLYQELVHI